jgi:hypothetical protein
MELARNQTGIPGMGVAIIHKGKLIFAEGFGKRNKKDPFTPEVKTIQGSAASQDASRFRTHCLHSVFN